MYRMACCDADPRYEAIAQSLHAVLRKEVERLQTNKSIEIQCACFMNDAAVQIDLVSSSSLTYNKSSLLLPPQVTNGYNSQSMRPKYFVAPTPLLFMRRNTSACDTAGVINVLNPPTKWQYNMTKPNIRKRSNKIGNSLWAGNITVYCVLRIVPCFAAASNYISFALACQQML